MRRQRSEVEEPWLRLLGRPRDEAHRFLRESRQHALEFEAGRLRSSVVVASHEIGRQVRQVERQRWSRQHFAVLNKPPSGLGKPEGVREAVLGRAVDHRLRPVDVLHDLVPRIIEQVPATPEVPLADHAGLVALLAEHVG